MKETVKDFPSRTEFYGFCIDRITQMAKANGNSTNSLDALKGALITDPKLVTGVIKRSVDIARAKLGQSREESSSLVLYVDTAMRTFGSYSNVGLVLPTLWDRELVLETFTESGNAIAKLAGENALGRNNPQRAAWMLSLLEETGLMERDLFFIEMGASAGFILDGLKDPTKFLAWAGKKKQATNATFDKKFDGVGFDLIPPPNLNWTLASLGDNDAIYSGFSFVKKFPIRSTVLKGNILEDTVWQNIEDQAQQASSRSQTPVIMASEMLYQLTAQDREIILDRTRNLLAQTQGVFLRSDGGQYMNFPQYELLTVGELRDSNFNLMTNQLLLKNKYRTRWEKL